MKEAHAFAQMLIARLREHCPEAAPLRAREARDGADLGIDDDGEFEPLLRVKNPSKATNVMSLWVHHHRTWEPTFVRGTPAELAEKLAAPFAYLWKIPVLAMGFDDVPPPVPKTRRPARRATRSR